MPRFKNNVSALLCGGMKYFQNVKTKNNYSSILQRGATKSVYLLQKRVPFKKLQYENFPNLNCYF